jgi:hypothetical protein
MNNREFRIENKQKRKGTKGFLIDKKKIIRYSLFDTRFPLLSAIHIHYPLLSAIIGDPRRPRLVDLPERTDKRSRITFWNYWYSSQKK